MITLEMGMLHPFVVFASRMLSLKPRVFFDDAMRSAVLEFQKAHSPLKADGIIGPQTWAALLSFEVNGFRVPGCSSREITSIVVHTTDSPWMRDVTADSIRKAHLARGFRDIGYHFLVRHDGSIFAGRPIDQIGAHAGLNSFNRDSIGICYIGGRNAEGELADTRTPEQMETLSSLIVEFALRYPLLSCVCGHRDCSSSLYPSEMENRKYLWLKSCPCFNALSEYMPKITKARAELFRRAYV